MAWILQMNYMQIWVITHSRFWDCKASDYNPNSNMSTISFHNIASTTGTNIMVYEYGIGW